MAKAVTFILTIMGGAIIGILASPNPHDRAGGAVLGAVLALPLILCALWIWQGADRHEDQRWAARQDRRAGPDRFGR